MAPEPESSPGEMAVQYLQRWAERDSDSGWKFSKKRQTWLLRAWPEPNKLGGEEFKQLLPYLRALAPNCRHVPPSRDRARESPRMPRVARARSRRERTLAQARALAERCQAEDQGEATSGGATGAGASDATPSAAAVPGSAAADGAVGSASEAGAEDEQARERARALRKISYARALRVMTALTDRPA